MRRSRSERSHRTTEARAVVWKEFGGRWVICIYEADGSSYYLNRSYYRSWDVAYAKAYRKVVKLRKNGR